MAGAPAVAALSLLAMTSPAHGAGARGHGPGGPSVVAVAGQTTADPAFPNASAAAQGFAHVMQAAGFDAGGILHRGSGDPTAGGGAPRMPPAPMVNQA